MDARSHQTDRTRKLTRSLDPEFVKRILGFAEKHIPDEAYCFRCTVGEDEYRKHGIRFEWEEDGLKFQTTVTEE